MATKAQTKIAYHQLGQTLRSLEEDLRWGLAGSVRIPQAPKVDERMAVLHEAFVRYRTGK